MHHSESPEQSAELLRQVIPLLSQHGGVCHPTHYALWYEYLAGTHLPLKRAIDECLAESASLTAAQCEKLHDRFLATREADEVERLQRSLQALLEQFAAMAHSAGLEAVEFQQQIAGTAGRLKEGLNVPALSELVGELAASAQRFQGVAGQLEERATESTAEIANLREQLGQIRSEASLDPLTQLFNRRGFEQALTALLAEREMDLAGCALLIADIDQFKRVNDTYGHLLGDSVIRGVARVLHETIRGGDIAARFGGEEFAVVLPDTAAADAHAVAENIRAAVARCRLRRAGSDEIIDGVTISLGVASAAPGETLESLIERADQALYRAKRAGRNRVEE